MAAHGRLGELQPQGQLGRGGRTVIEDGPGHAIAGAPLIVVRALILPRGHVRKGLGPGGRLGRGVLGILARVFHNTIVA
ncbi:hypothetical protein GCM10010219_00130 [Streptomyces netropsis]|nr:hypothetical protein GCM10010219_00130 [Streptomyces netropsis]